MYQHFKDDFSFSLSTLAKIVLFFRQADIGLQKFHTKDLFVRLITPTFFVIITAIQMNYFHKDFLAISDIKSRYVNEIYLLVCILPHDYYLFCAI